MSRIFLIRHGEIVGNSPEHRYLGQLDPPLSERGQEQVVRLARHPLLEPLSKVLSSPLQRCRESAAIITHEKSSLHLEIVPELAEIALGDWEGLSIAEVRRRFPEEYKARGRDLAGFRPPGGESFADLLTRVWPVFLRAAGEKGDVAFISHAGVNRVLLCTILGMPLAHLFRLGQDYGSISVIDGAGERLRVMALNVPPLCR